MSGTRQIWSGLSRFAGLALLALAPLGLAACDESATTGAGMTGSVRATHPIAPELLALMEQKGLSPSAPILIRAYKKEAELEIWKMKSDGRYVLFKTFPMCRWSGQLGPKTSEGDRQVPEGFYRITPGQMNPNSEYYLSFNVGYPNAYDRAWGHSGGSIFVHGACSSAGCFSMTDRQIDQIYAIAREAFSGGQQAIQMQSYPFRMTPENLARYRNDPNIGFWKQLKEGADNFEISKQDVGVGVCNRRYVFNVTATHLDPSGPCPVLQHDGIQELVEKKQADDEAKIEKLVASGIPAVRTIYADGGQHPEFSAQHLADVSRPEALTAPTEWVVTPAGPRAKPRPAASSMKALARDKGGDPADRTATIKKPDPAAPQKPQAAL